MFGRVPVLIIEMEIRSKPSSINSLSDKVGDAPPDFSEKQNIDKAQERRKKSYDAKHRPVTKIQGGQNPVAEKPTERGKKRR